MAPQQLMKCSGCQATEQWSKSKTAGAHLCQTPAPTARTHTPRSVSAQDFQSQSPKRKRDVAVSWAAAQLGGLPESSGLAILQARLSEYWQKVQRASSYSCNGSAQSRPSVSSHKLMRAACCACVQGALSVEAAQSRREADHPATLGDGTSAVSIRDARGRKDSQPDRGVGTS